MTLNQPDVGEPAGIAWARDVPLLTNRFVLYDGMKLFAWAFLILNALIASIFVIEGSWKAFPAVVELFAWVLAGLVLLFALIMLVVFMNRFPMRMSVNARGASIASGSRLGKAGNRLAIAVGALGGRPAVAAAGVLGAMQEHVGLKWDAVRRVKEHPGQRVISLMNDWRVVFRLYCTDENYQTVADFVRAHAAEGARQHAARRAAEAAQPKAPSDIARNVPMSIATVAGALLVMATSLEFDRRLLAACVVLTLAAVWLPSRRTALGLVSLCATLVILVLIVREGWRVQHLVPESVLNGAPEPDWSRTTAWATLDREGWARLAVTSLGLVALAAVQLVAVRRPSSASTKPQRQTGQS